MPYDQAQSPRLGQKTPVESTTIRMFDGTEIPEASWMGQMIYRNDLQILQVFNGSAWENVVGSVAGLLTFVGPSVPTSQNAGDLWYDSDDDHKLYRAASAGADAIAAGEWEAVLIGNAAITEDAMDGKTITGAILQTSTAGARVKIENASGSDDIKIYTGSANEEEPGTIGSGSTATSLKTVIGSPTWDGGSLWGVGDTSSEIQLIATEDNTKINLSSNGSLGIGGEVNVDTGLYGGLKLNATGDRVWAFARGRKNSGTTDSNSRVSFNHGISLGLNTIASVAITPGDSRNYYVVNITAGGGTQITVEVRNASGSLVGSGVAVDFFWQVWA